jgi:hypothetical protein
MREADGPAARIPGESRSPTDRPDHRDAFAAALAELAAGRPWNARDRLAGRLSQRPADQDVLDLLGQVCDELGDQVAAGRWWFLTDRDDDAADAARAAFLAVHDQPWKAANALRVRAPATAYPPAARARLADLAERVRVGGGTWVPGRPASLTPPEAPKPGGHAWVDLMVTGALLVGTVGVWLVGAIALVALALDAVT